MKHMKATIIVVMVLIMAMFCMSCTQSSTEDEMIKIFTDIENSEIDFKIQNVEQRSYHYKIYYNGKIYKEYTKTESEWSILYDYSHKDVTQVTIGVFEAEDDSSALFTKSVLIVIDPAGYDFSQNELDIYYASRYPTQLSDIAKLNDRVVSITLNGPSISGDINDLLVLRNLEVLQVINTENVTGNIEALLELNHLVELRFESCPNIKETEQTIN